MSNFWAEFSFPSPVDDILKKPSFTLEELLDEDDVVVDIRSQKDELKEYFLKEESLKKLMQYISEEAPEDATDAVKFRHLVAVLCVSNVLCALLQSSLSTPAHTGDTRGAVQGSDLYEIERELLANEGYLDSLFKFFQNPNANPLLANLVIKVISSLMNSKLSGVILYLKKNPPFLEDIVSFIHVASVFDFLHRLVINVENEYEGRGTLEWLAEINFHKVLLSRFSVEHKIIHAEICRLVVELIVTSSENSTLFQKVMEPESLEVLFELSSQEGNLTGFRYGMNIIAYMLQIINPDFRGSDLIPMTADISHLPLVAQKMLKSTPILLQQVISPPVSREITNQMGQKVEAFGFIRLAVLQCIDNLLALGYTKVIDELVTSHPEIYSRTLDLMIQFHSNNFCHLVVERIFASTISLSDDTTVVEFAKTSGLPQALISHSKHLISEPRPLYAPFIHRIGNILIDRQQSVDKLSSFLSGIEGWEDFVSRASEERLKHTQLNPFGDSFDKSTDDRTMSLSEDSSDSSNDANDYDTDQAEILLSKLEIEAAA